MIDIGNVDVATSFGLQVEQCKQTGSCFKESMVQSISIYRAVLKDCGPFQLMCSLTYSKIKNVWMSAKTIFATAISNSCICSSTTDRNL